MKKCLELLKSLIPSGLIGLTLIALLRESDLISVGRILDLILGSFDRVLGVVMAPIELALSRIIRIFELPSPDRVWRYLFVCSIFMHVRSFQVEWENPSVRWLALILFTISFSIALIGSFFIGLLGIKEAGLFPLACVVALMSVLEIVRNTIMGLFKLPKDRPEVNRKQNLIYYHMNWTLGYTVAMLVSLPITYSVFSSLTDNLATVGFFVLYICIVVFLVFHFLFGFLCLSANLLGAYTARDLRELSTQLFSC